MKFFKKLSRSVKGRVAIITGAGSGMGEATAKVFASEGVKIIATDINFEEVKRVAGEIQEVDGICTPLLLDVTDKSAIDKDAPNNYLTYCGFSKPHPHINESIIRIAFVNNKEKIDIVTLLVGVAESAIMIYNTIGDEFKTE